MRKGKSLEDSNLFNVTFVSRQQQYYSNYGQQCLKEFEPSLFILLDIFSLVYLSNRAIDFKYGVMRIFL